MNQDIIKVEIYTHQERVTLQGASETQIQELIRRRREIAIADKELKDWLVSIGGTVEKVEPDVIQPKKATAKVVNAEVIEADSIDIGI